ncbi:MAG: hypothetical protein LBP61_02730, partial [Desulfovibrio sp.]|nr:hypothetical protein [Desulfovibrio sp.]
MSQTNSVQRSVVQISRPAPGAIQIIPMPPASAGSVVFLDFDPGDGVSANRSGNNLLFIFDDGSQIALVDFFVTSDRDLPLFRMADGAEAPGAALLAALDSEMDLSTAAGPAERSGGAGDYADDWGTLVGGLDRLGMLDADYWTRGGGLGIGLGGVAASFPLPTVSIGAGLTVEGQDLVFTLTQSHTIPAAVSINWSITLPAVSVRAGEASYDDFDAPRLAARGIRAVDNGDGTWTLSGTAAIPAGSTQGNIVLPIRDEADFELDETLSINLGSAVNATIVGGAGLGVIENDDAVPSLTIDDVSVAEGGDLVFTVSQSQATQAETTASWSVTLPAVSGTPGQASYDDLDSAKFAANGITATDNGDGTWSLSGKISIAAGQTTA